jgi:hypothetical protein
MNFSLRHRIAWLGIAAGFAAIAQALADDIKPGKWEYTFQMQMPNVPAMPAIPSDQLAKLPPAARAQLQQMQQGHMSFTNTSCVTADHLVPPTGSRNGECTVAKLERTGSDVSYAASCTSKEGRTTTIEGQIHYSGDAMAGEFHVHTAARDGKATDVTQQISGRYLGPCG